MLKVKDELNEKGQQYHICCVKGDVGRYVLLPGDPFRTDIIAKRLDDAKLIAHNREHKTWTGYLDGEKVSVCSTGMGCPSTAIALEELIHCGADTFIRIGTAGRLCEASFEEGLRGVIVTGSVRDEGTTRHYIPIEYPAIADRRIVAALAEAAEKRGYNYREGLAQCKDAFYGQIDPDGLPNGPLLKQRWQAWKEGGVMASEMETAALFIISSIRGCRAGAVMSFQSMDETITLAVDALRTLIAADRKQA
ncbi:MAG: nucleoside phosphorylase [Oscillospiraceae bacterium]|nr:nucleoside phosphorylase [Oscillospiraceae bacterium]